VKQSVRVLFIEPCPSQGLVTCISLRADLYHNPVTISASDYGISEKKEWINSACFFPKNNNSQQSNLLLNDCLTWKHKYRKKVTIISLCIEEINLCTVLLLSWL
jgi:hypothetical protein